MGKGQDTVTVNTGFMVPNGILKVLEINMEFKILLLVFKVFNIVVLALVASRWGCTFRSRPISYRDWEACLSSKDFTLAISIIFFLLTLLLFLLFLFNVPAKCGGKRTWNIIDAVHNCLAFILYFVAFVMACIWAGRYDAMIALAVFAVLCFICYVLSFVFVVLELKGQRVG